MDTSKRHECLSPVCGSSDGMAVYEEGTGYCFSCNSYFSKADIEGGGEGISAPVSDAKSSEPLPTGSPANVPSRGLQEHSLAYYGVTVGHSETDGSVNVLNFPVYRNGEHVGTKIKDITTKEWTGKGSLKAPDLFGQKQAGTGGKLLIITEGEEQ